MLHIQVRNMQRMSTPAAMLGYPAIPPKVASAFPGRRPRVPWVAVTTRREANTDEQRVDMSCPQLPPCKI